MRSNLQPSRRYRTVYKKEDDLILWLKFNEGFSDSSNYSQATLTHPSAPGPPEISQEAWHDGAASAQFFGGNALAISGEGADVSNAHLLDFGENDFTIELAAQFAAVAQEEKTLFDWGNFKLTTWRGVFSIHTPNPENPIIDYYDGDLLLDVRFNEIAITRRDGLMNLFINGQAVTEDRVHQQITGLQEYHNMRSIASNLDGTDPFDGYIDDFKVYRSAIHGPEPSYINDEIYVDGIILGEDTEGITEHSHLLEIDDQTTTSVRVEVNTMTDKRSDPNSPLPYEVHWFRDGQNLFDSPSGPTTDAIYGKVIKDKYKNTLKITGFSEKDNAIYDAKILFPKIEVGAPEIEETELQKIESHHTTLADPPTIDWCENWGTSSVVVNEGEDAQLYVTVKGGLNPLQFIWKRNGRRINEGPNVYFESSLSEFCSASIKFLNVTHNISGITCEVIDGSSSSSEVYVEGNVFVNSPRVIHPIVHKLTPSDDLTPDLKIIKGRKETSEGYHLASYEFSGWPARGVIFHIFAENVNSDLWNVGDLKYEWYIDDKWTSGDQNREFLLELNQPTRIKCRVGFTQKEDIYTYVIINVNCSNDVCDLPTTYITKEIPSNKTREYLTVYTGEKIPFSYYYVCCADTQGQSLDPEKFVVSDDAQISAGPASSILNLDYSFSEDYSRTLDNISFERVFWLDDNDNEGEQNVKVTFSNALGDKELKSFIKVIKGKSINGNIGSGESIIALPNSYQEDRMLKGWVAPSSTLKRRVYYRVLVNGTDVSDYRPVPAEDEILPSVDAVYKSNCLELSFVKASGSSGSLPLSVRILGQSSCWTDGDTFTLEFYNNLPAENDFINADKFSKTFTVRVVDPPEIISPMSNSLRWTLVPQTQQSSNGKDMHLIWAYDSEDSKWYIYPHRHARPEFDETFSQVPSAR